MATSSAVRWKLSTTAKSPVAFVRWIVNTTSGHSGDFLRFTLTLTNRVGAFLAGTFLPATNRQIGVRIEMDLGDGALTLIKGSELDGAVSLTGTLDGYGTRSLSFSRYGIDQNPMQSTLLRGMRALKMTLYRGLVGAVGSKVLFNGYVTQGSYGVMPPVAQISGVDESIKHADKRLVYTLEAGSKRSRVSVLQDICTANSIPVGTWELPFPFRSVFGDAVVPSGLPGGTVYKAISEGGDRPVLDFIQQFIEPIGCKMYWRDGAMNIKRFDMGGPVVATLGGGDIRNAHIDPPATNAVNSAQFSGTIFSYTGPTGLHTTFTSVPVPGVYAPLVAVNKQDHTSGVVSATGLSSGAASRVISRVDTTTTWDGGTIVSQSIDEYGWYAPRAANKRLGGGTTYNATFDVYQFADNTWRSTAQEDFQLIRRTVTARAFDVNGFLTGETSNLYAWRAIETPFATLNNATGAEVAIDVLATDEGSAWVSGVEGFVIETDFVNYTPVSSSDLRIAQKATFSQTTADLYRPITNPGGAYAGTIWVLGPTNAKRYVAFRITSSGPIEVWRSIVNYYDLGESQHGEQVSVTDWGYIRTCAAILQQPTTLGNLTVAGAWPILEQKTALQQAQPATVKVFDDVQTALGGGIDRPDTRQNDYCETDGELRNCAIEDLRTSCSVKVTLEIDVNASIDEGSVIQIADHRLLDYGIQKLLVWTSTLNLQGGLQPNATQTLVCRWYPPELLVA